MKRRDFIKAGALLALVPSLTFAKPLKTFKIVSPTEMENLIDELVGAYPNRKIQFGSKITKNTVTRKSINQPHYLVRLDITDTIISVNDIIKI